MKYDIILADPPWYFRNWSADEPGMTHNRSRGAAKHYPTMTTKDICALPVRDLARDDSILFIWTTWAHLHDVAWVINDWGFKVVTNAWVWVKSKNDGTGFRMGNGYYTRKCTEPCLLATRGNVGRPFDKGVSDIIYAPRRKHSQKPDEQYDKIDRLYPHLQGRLELFARQPREGWHVWGNEVESDVDL